MAGNPVYLAIILLLTGLIFFFLVWGLLRLISRSRRGRIQTSASSLESETGGHGRAVILVQSGGRVEFLNKAAREWFKLKDGEQPNLEVLARRIRPSEDLLRLCMQEGEARFSVNSRPAEGISFRVPAPVPTYLISLTRSDFLGALTPESKEASGSALRILTDFIQSISTQSGLTATVQAIVENVERLVPAEYLAVKIWDAEQQMLVPYEFGAGREGERTLEKGLPHASDGYSGFLIKEKRPLMIPDTHTFTAVPPKPGEEKLPIRSYLGMPLQTGEKVVGTIEIGLAATNGFSQENVEVIQLVAGQAAVSILNAAELEKERQRAVELSGLANLAKAMEASQDTKDLYNRLVQSLAPLFDVDILGFLIHDENRHTLEAQVPFIGMPAQIVELYHIPLQTGSRAEERFLSQTVVMTRSAMDDPLWQEMGFQDYARAASWRDTALIPLVSAGRSLGYLQISNHRRESDAFSREELRLANIVANQVAPIIDNVALIQQARLRTQRSEGLRRIASLASSVATSDEILHYTVQELVRLLQADLAAIFLLDEVGGVLRLHPQSLFGLDPETAQSLPHLFVDDPQFHFTVTGGGKAILSGRISTDQGLLPLYRSVYEKFAMESLIVAPLVIHDRGLGELMIACKRTDYFNPNDLQTVLNAAGQLAVAIQGASLGSQTDKNLRQRVDQLTSLTRIGRELHTTMDWKYLLQVVYDESLRTTHADCGTILLFGSEAETAKTPRVIFHLGDDPGPKLLPVERDALKRGNPIIVADYSHSSYKPTHEGVQSALVMPISYQQEVRGLIHLHSTSPECFEASTGEIVQALAIQAAIALGNAQRFQEEVQHVDQLNRRSGALTKLFETTSALAVGQSLENSLDLVASALQEATPFQVVVISLLEPETMMQHRIAGVGMPVETLNRLRAHQQPWSGLQQLLKPTFKVGSGYFIPAEKTPVSVASGPTVSTLVGTDMGPSNAWKPEDVLLYPLYDAESNPIGVITLESPRDGLRPDQATLDTLDLFSAQASVIVQTTRRLATYQAQVSNLTTSVDRQQQLLSISQTHLPTLLHKDLEQTIAIRNLERRARRIRAGLEITETVNRQVDGPSALLALGREMLTRLEMSVSIVAENTSEGPRLLHVLGNIPRSTSPEALFGQRNPLRHCLQTGETLLAMNLEQDETWREAPLLTSLHAKGFVCLPVTIDEKPVAGIMAISPEPMPPLKDEDQQVFFQIARQVSIILENISLLTETRRRLREVNLLLDFSRQLSGLGPDSILNALLESSLRVVSAAHAGVVLMYNDQEDDLVPIVAANYANDESLMAIVYHPGEALPGQVYLEKKPRRVDEVNFARDYNLPAEHLLRYREATAGRLPVSSMLIPIQAGERILGLMVLDNFNTAGAFSADDEALLLSLTQQVALSLENVRLVQASQERANQLQALTEVSATMTSSLMSGELVSGLLDRLHGVLSYDTAILWLRDGAHMSVAAARGFSDNEERIGLSVAIEDSALLAEMIRTSQGIVVGDVRSDSRFPSLIEAERLSWMGVPLVSKGEVAGVIALEKTEAHFFTLELSQLVTTFASQAAVSLENARLYEDSLRRASELDQRSQRLSLLNRLSADLSSSLDEDQVLRLTAEQLQRALMANKVSAISFDRFGVPNLRVSVPFDKSFHIRVLPGAPIFERLRESLGVFSTENVKGEADLDGLADQLEGTQSLLVLPLVGATNLRALLFVHMAEAHHFSPTDIDLATTIGNQAAVALESARLYQATVSRAEQLTTINRASYEMGLSLDPEQIYAAIHRAVSELMPAESFVIALLDEERKDIEGVYLMDPGGRSPNVRLPLGEGISGKVVSSGEPLLISDTAQVENFEGRTYGEGQPRSIVGVPITQGGKVVGMLSAQSYQPNVYSEDEQQILGTLANQAAVAIQNGRLYAETRRLADELEQRVVERTAELQQEQRNTETLLRILTEASSTLDLDRALNRTLALLNNAIGAEQGSILMVNPEDNTIHYRSGYGYLTPDMTKGSRPTALKIGEGLAGWVIKHREAVRIDDVRKDKRWVKIPLNTSSHRSVIAAPLIVGAEIIGAIMVFHRQVGFFTPEHMNLVQAIGSQVAVAINNAQLYELIRDQAERLGSMLRNQQVEASRQKAILEAVADGVLVTDPSNVITFLNSSSERILDLREDQVIGQPLESFVGLFGKAAQTWMQTIHFWSEDPASHQQGDTYAEQLTLETGKVVLVHLAPVIWRNEFLGTVSIFRDITHEVEVDRLKSEFVATVSHELRTPMTSIKGYVDLLLMGAAGALNENQSHFLDIVRSNTERLSVLVNDLLDISRIEAGRVSLSLQAIDLREVAEDVASEIQRRSQEENKPMDLKMDISKKLPRITGDLERVRQILANIVDNAYHYTPAQGTITIHMEEMNGEVQVDVKDSGIGIPPEEQERVFERFYRGEDPLVLATPGTGLGLAIVKQLVTMHKGRIWLKSAGVPGDGSTFSFTLPVYTAEE